MRHRNIEQPDAFNAAVMSCLDSIVSEDVSARPTEQPGACDRHKTGTQSQRHDPHGVPTVLTYTR